MHTTVSVGKFGQFLTPPPLKNADVLNWPLQIYQIESLFIFSLFAHDVGENDLRMLQK